MSEGGPTSQSRCPAPGVLATAILASCEGDFDSAIEVLTKAADMLCLARHREIERRLGRPEE